LIFSAALDVARLATVVPNANRLAKGLENPQLDFAVLLKNDVTAADFLFANAANLENIAFAENDCKAKTAVSSNKDSLKFFISLDP
jgi:hypothetical protein